MAINRGVLGSQTGSMGGITASNWKGRNVYKQKVPATNSSNSPAQAMQRRKFALLAALAGQLGSAIRAGFRGQASDVTEQNLFTSRNFALVSDDGTVSTLDALPLQLSAGIVLPLAQFNATLNMDSGNLTVTGVDNSNGADGLPTDIAYFAVYNKVTGRAVAVNSSFTRSMLGVARVIAAGVADQAADLVVYGFAKRATSTAASPTISDQVS